MGKKWLMYLKHERGPLDIGFMKCSIYLHLVLNPCVGFNRGCKKMQKSFFFYHENNNEFKTTMARWEATHYIPYRLAFMLNMFKMLLENYMLESLLS
jgi:hypothetical protein